MNEAIQKLIDLVQKATPVMWQAAYRQAFIDGAENVLGVIALLVGGTLLLKFAQRLRFDHADEVGIFFAYLGSVVAYILVFPFLTGAIDCFANPTMVAIKSLKGLL